MPDRAEYLLALTVGPVGEFIGAGRRSRDLWYGSEWLSTLTAEVATFLRDIAARRHGMSASLMVPRAGRTKQLRGHNRMLRFRSAVPNKVLALVWSDLDDCGPRIPPLVNTVQARASKWFHDQLEFVIEQFRERQRRRGLLGAMFDGDALRRELDAIRDGDFIEQYAVWVPWTEAQAAESLASAFKLLEARKNTRLFRAPAFSRDGRPKSHLDAGRDSILAEPDDRNRAQLERLRRAAGVRAGEQLDAVGTARRLALFAPLARGTPAPALPVLPFPPLSRVAADGWIRSLKGAARERLHEVAKALVALRTEDEDAFYAISSPAADDWDDRPVFAYDSAILFEGGMRAAENDYYSRTAPPAPDIAECLRRIGAAVKDLHREAGGLPEPYYALLAFDGDGVGSLYEGRDRDGIDKLTEALDEFADRATEYLGGREVHGCPFYVGGDEGMLYLPLDRLLLALRGLDDIYRETVEAEVRRTGDRRPAPLSFGAVVAHMHHDLRAVRSRALEARRVAKSSRRTAGDRSGWLRVVELPRGGSERACSGPTATLVDWLERWGKDIDDDHISPKTAHELKQFVAAHPVAEKAAGARAVDLVDLLDAVRAFAHFEQKRRRRGGSGQGSLDLADRLGLRSRTQLPTWDQLRELPNEILLAQRLRAQAPDRARGRNG